MTGPAASEPTFGLQLYTVRDDFRADHEGTLARIAQLGYEVVEPFDIVAQADRLSSLASHGLRAPSAHLNFLADGADLSAGFAVAAELGIATVIEPYVDPARWRTADDIRRTADALGAAVPVAAAHGIRIGYHNHAFEFTETDGLDVLADALDPAVVLEVDTYWAATAGQDVPALLHRLGERVRLLHLQDGPIDDPDAPQTAVGAGRMPIAAILAAVPRLEVGVVELDTFAGDVWDAVRDSLRYLSP